MPALVAFDAPPDRVEERRTAPAPARRWSPGRGLRRDGMALTTATPTSATGIQVHARWSEPVGAEWRPGPRVSVRGAAGHEQRAIRMPNAHGFTGQLAEVEPLVGRQEEQRERAMLMPAMTTSRTHL